MTHVLGRNKINLPMLLLLISCCNAVYAKSKLTVYSDVMYLYLSALSTILRYWYFT